ncbi:Phage protein [Bacillus thuringiensis serovar israelensis ATCC 35646]|nr:Phage protein [Bacillus thuringiensis serovar israelensis ATCC 35646]
MTAEIDLKTNGIYIVKNGQVQLIEPPQGGFGEQSFIYQSGKVIRMEERKTQLI